MVFLADILLATAALLAALYCYVLSRRLRKFTDLENGVGGAVKMLSIRASELDKSIKVARSDASQSVKTLEDVSARAEAAARHLELLVASLHSLPDAPKTNNTRQNPFRAERQRAAARLQDMGEHR